ncbi:MAG: SDR family NAD(P)-dependent oxidoreductase, partial [Myxococcales bacterium]
MSNTSRHCPIAVVGVSALFPGSQDETGFWRDILAGRDLMREVPPTHWLVEDYFDADPAAPDKTYARRGAFLDPVEFDALGFGVPPSIMPATDTSQLLALIVAQRVLEDAAHGQFASLDKERISVILGVTSAQELLASMVSRLQRPVWVKSLREAGVPESKVQEVCDRIAAHYPPWQEASFPGLLGNVVAGRIANRFDLGGTNCVTDAACGSALSAVAMAVSELYLGDSDMVITGGVDTLNDIFMYMCFSKTPALSPSGDCRPFSDGADGTMLGEGIGMVALKRLEDAEAAGDRIYAVIKGVGTSSDGRAKSVYAPRPEGQARALRRAYERAGYAPRTVELLEAHGTGTKAGDVAEVEGLNLAFGAANTKDRQWCALGSIKSQIGHTKAAAGAAGLLKVVLALNHGVLPPTIKVERPNPKLELEKSPFYVNTRARPWVRGSDHPRRASVSAFGFGGSNFHVTLEEYRGATRALRKRTCAQELVVLGAASPQALVQSLRGVEVGERGFLAWFARHTQESLPRGSAARVAILASDEAELRARLAAAADAIERTPDKPFSLPNGIHYGVGAREGGVAFLFPGQGSQYVEMGAGVASVWPEALAVWDLAADVVEAPEKLHEVVFPRPAFTDKERQAQADKLRRTEWAQPALCATSLSYLRLLESLGIRPDSVGGHSFGEIVALHAAGAFDAATALRIARRRGELMAEAAKVPGAMVAAFATIEQVREAIAEIPEVVVANHNAPKQVVLSGPVEAIEKAEQALRSRSIRAERLQVATAFHSPVVAESTKPFEAFLAGIDLAKPALPVFANAEAAPYPADPAAMRALLASQLVRPVRFVEQVEAMYASGVRTFLEVGAGAVLTGLVGRILADRPHRALSVDAKGKAGAAAFHDALGRLWAAGFEPDFAALWRSFQPTSDPRKAAKPRLALAICGANYGKPYPPAEGAAALPPPNPEPEPEPVRPAVAAPEPQPASAAAPAPESTNPAAQTVPAAPAAPAPTPAEPGWLAAFQQLQRETAEAQTAWHNAMTQAHLAYLQTAERAFAGLGAMAAGLTLPAFEPAAVAAPPPANLTAEQVPRRSTPSGSAHPEPSSRCGSGENGVERSLDSGLAGSACARGEREADRAQGDCSAPLARPTAPVNAAPAPVPAAAAPAPQAPASRQAATAASGGLAEALLAVVAEKTGYPAEMLNLQMSLESDLGIDSIKRVEILSGLRARVPNLPEVEPGAMARLQTLGAIVEYLGETSGSVRCAPCTKPNGAATQRANGSTGSEKPNGAASIDLKHVLLSVVAEKTGYPAEMLNLQMGLESDLGIDSIKRVEILSALRARVPGLPDVEPAAMARLQTLGAIVEQLEQAAGNAAPAPKKTNGASAHETPAVAPSVDLKEVLLSVVAEKTGYPAEMLNLQMGLESDLGIDSIKRVEILSALRARVPGLPDVEPAAMARLQTLGAIVEQLERAAGCAAPAPKKANGATAHETPAGAPSIDLKEVLLSVVAEKTGYPAEMLNLQMGLESDLGIDSIKRVEILSALRARVPNLPDVEPAAMARLQTLGAIVEQLEGNVGAAAPTTAARDASATSAAPETASATIDRLVVEPFEAPAIGLGMPGITTARRLVVTGGSPALADALVASLRKRGIPAERLDEVPSDADAVIFLGGLQDSAAPEAAELAVRAAFRAARAVAPRFARDCGLFVTVQDTGGDFGLSGSERALLGGIAGIAKTASLEWPAAAVKAIDLERGARDAAALAEILTAELLEGGTELEVGLRADGQRLSIRAVPRALDPSTSPLLDEKSVVVATGGARGVTAACLVELARQTRARFLLLGRTRLDDEPEAVRGATDDASLKRALLQAASSAGERLSPAELGARARSILAAREVRATLEAIRAAGGEARYAVADARDAASLRAALAEARAAWGPITAIVHAAGIIADQLIAQKTDERFDLVYDTKVVGLLNLLQATSSDPLRVIGLFSSAAARSGNPGQCDYAAANEVLNKLAALEARRRGPACVVRAFGWGPWDGGMVDSALRAHFEAHGTPLIPLAAGAAAFVAELQHGGSAPVELVLGAALPARPSIQGASFDMLVTRASHPYLADHAIDGVPVLPVALALEWFARAAKAARPDLELVACRDVRVLKGARLGRYLDGGDRFTVRCKEIEPNRLGLELRGPDGTLFYTATAELSTCRPKPAAPPPEPAALEELGRAIYGYELFHGPQFQVIESLEGVSKQGA